MEQLQMSFDYSTPTTPTGLIPGGDGTVKKYYRKAAHRFVNFFYLFLVVKFIIILIRYWFIDRWYLFNSKKLIISFFVVYLSYFNLF